ncbi:hypothetical protein [Agromyces sp. NPDC058064]|uniref:hypothetical protein n=1 Tax=Agromyces sp. NPDC058064 TaxID=3346322 RepID=UPI0036DC03B3
MSAERESRPGTNRTAKVNLSESIVSGDEPNRARPHLIGASVEKALDGALWDLIHGRTGLHELTPALAGFYTLGHAAGIKSAELTIARLQFEADRLYVQAFNPADRARIIQQRMDEHFAAEWERFLNTEGGSL